jgi:hypothetical protein
VAKGFRQVAGGDYDEVFAPTAQDASFRILLAIAAEKGLLVKQLDVKTAFLDGELSEELYLKLPQEIGGKTEESIIWTKTSCQGVACEVARDATTRRV